MRYLELKRNATFNVALACLSEFDTSLGETYTEVAPQILKNRQVAQAAEDAWDHFRGGDCRVLKDTAAKNLMGRLGLTVRDNVAWSAGYLRDIVGFGKPDEIEAAMRLKNPGDIRTRLASERYRYLPPSSPGALVIPYRTSPDLIDGFVLVSQDSKGGWRIQKAPLPYVGEDLDAGGLVGHPSRLSERSRVMFFPSFRVALQAMLTWSLEAKSAAPIVTAVDGSDGVCRNLQMLAERKTILWSPQLNAPTLRYATTLSADSVIDPGPAVSTPDLLKRWGTLGDVGAKIRDIEARATPWSKVVALRLSEQPLESATDLLHGCRLGSLDLDAIAENLSEQSHGELLEALRPSWPYFRIVAKSGTVEQRESGWYHLQGEREELITNAPFRINQVRVDEDGTIVYQVNIKYGRDEHTVDIPKAVLDKSPMRAIQDELIRLQVGLTTYASHWERQAMHLSLQFYGRAEVDLPQPVGYSPDEQVFRTTHMEFSLSTGHVSSRTGKTTRGSLLPLGTTGRNTREFIVALGNNPFAINCVLAYTAQLLAESRGEDVPFVAVTRDDELLPIRVFLDRVGVLSGGDPVALTKYRVGGDSTQSTRQKLPSHVLWDRCDKRVAWFYAGDRNYITIAGDPSRWPSNLDAVNLQQLVVYLLSVCMRNFKFCSVDDAVYKAWRHRLKREIGDLQPTKHKFRQSTTCDAIAGIISEAIETGQLACIPKPDRNLQTMNVFQDRVHPGDETQAIGFPKAAINQLLSSWGMGRWNMSEILNRVMPHADHFLSQSLRARQSCWLFTEGTFSVDTRRFLRVETQQARKSS